MFAALSELCAKCYALVFKSELLSPVHITYLITSLLQTSKSKNTGLIVFNFLFLGTEILLNVVNILRYGYLLIHQMVLTLESLKSNLKLIVLIPYIG